MSARSSIVNAIVEKLKLINGNTPYTANLYENVYAKLKFWDEINDFPALYVVPGSEAREYLPADFTWGHLNVSIKVYVQGDDPQGDLQVLLEDIERVINANRTLAYTTEAGAQTTEILISSIITDEGLLHPYGVGEVNLQVRYQVLT